MSRPYRAVLPILLLAVGAGAQAESMAEWEAHQRTRTEEAKANSGNTSSNFPKDKARSDAVYGNLDLSIPPGLSAWANGDVHALTPEQVAANAAYEEAYDKAMAAERGKPWDQTVADAKGGDANAELEVAFAFDRGLHGIEQNADQALQWFRRAAEHGSMRAAYNLGATLINAAERKETVDMTEAVRWLRVAADGGEPMAFSGIAWCCLEHRGIDATPEETFKYLGLAARGDRHWSRWMSYCYATGFGTAKDPAQAFTWAKQAADDGDADAMYDVGERYEDGDGVEADPKQAFAWMSKALAAGKVAAAYDVGDALVFGKGTEVDEPRGVALMRQCAEAGNSAAQTQLAAWMVDGKRGITADVPAALDLLRKAMAQDDPSAFHEMAVLLQNGRPPYLEADDAASFDCLRKAVDKGGDSDVIYLLGMYHVLGKGTAKDPDTGVPLVMAAAEQGCARAQYQASIWLMDGNHMDKDIRRGVDLLTKAADQDNVDALMTLARLYARGAFEGVDPQLQHAQALNLYRKAAELGSEDARAKLTELGGN